MLLTERWRQTHLAPEASRLWAYKLPVLVIVWIGVLIVLAWWASGAPLMAQDTCSSCKTNLVSIGKTLNRYADHHQGSYPVTLAALQLDGQRNGYLTEIPRCRKETPSLFAAAIFQTTTGVRFTEYEYQRSTAPASHSVYCTAGAHAWDGIRRGYPQYTSGGGLIDGPTP